MIYLQLFWTFFRIGMIAFGGVFGVLSQLEQAVVVEHGWVTHQQFVEAFVVGQFVPGPNIAMCPLLGFQIAGFGGWLAAFLGIYCVPVLMMALAYRLYTQYREVSWVRRFELSLRPLVLGLILASAITLFWQQAFAFPAFALGLTVFGIVLNASDRLGPLRILLGLGVLYWAGVQTAHVFLL